MSAWRRSGVVGACGRSDEVPRGLAPSGTWTSSWPSSACLAAGRGCAHPHLLTQQIGMEHLLPTRPRSGCLGKADRKSMRQREGGC